MFIMTLDRAVCVCGLWSVVRFTCMLTMIIIGGKSTENQYSSTSTITLLKYYSITSKSTGVRKILQ